MQFSTAVGLLCATATAAPPSMSSIVKPDLPIVAVQVDTKRVATANPVLPTHISAASTPSAGGAMAMALSGQPTVAGRIASSFTVSSSGSATYSVPIWVAPGIAGLTPQLTLSYSSSAGNSLVGEGWGLAGLSSIVHCGKTWVQNGQTTAAQLQDATDRYCLDGQQLRLKSGTYGADLSTYGTELEQFSHVIAHGAAGSSPAWWEVKTKSGLIFEYGNTTDSRIESLGTTTPRSWAVSKVHDRVGNSMTFAYVEDLTNGSYRPSLIKYTASASGQSAQYQVKFNYEARLLSDTLVGYALGGLIKDTNRLASIESQYWSGSVFATQRTLNLIYDQGAASGRTRLVTLQSCGPTNCLKTTNIVYQNGAAGLDAETTGPTLANPANALAIDLNGDGRTDLIYPNGTTWYYALAGAGGLLGTPVNTLVSVGVSTASAALPIDFNSDGRMDLIVPSGVGGTWRVIYQLGTTPGIGTFTTLDTLIPYDNGGFGRAAVADVNGDGREDFITLGTTTLQAWMNSGSSFTAAGQLGPIVTFASAQPLGASQQMLFRSPLHAADFNGDARADLLVNVQGAGWSLWVSAPNGTYVQRDQLGTGLDAQPLLLDLNGDGCTDLAYSSAGFWHVRLSTCGRAGTTNLLTADVNTSQPNTGYANAIAVDWDGDGRMDVLAPNGSVVVVLRSSGETLITGVPTTIADYGATGYPKVTDANGDGLVDLTIFAGSVEKHRLHLGLMPDLATSFTDGYGMNVTPTYKAMSQDGACYAFNANSLPTFPTRAFTGPAYTACSYVASDGRGGTYTSSRSYYQASVDLQGRGFLGVAQAYAIDSRDGIIRGTYYSQSFPTVGMLTQDFGSQPGWVYFTDVKQLTWNSLAAGSGFETRTTPYLSQSMKYAYEYGGALNGQFIRQTQTNFTVDSYANVTNATTTVTDQNTGSPYFGEQYTTQVVNTITNDAANWCLGRPTQTTIANTIPGGASQTRTSGATIDYALCRTTQEVIEPLSSTLKITKTFGFDTCGNVNSVAIVGKNPDGTDMAMRTSSSSYGTRCQFAESQTNALGQTSTLSYNYGLGLPISQSDPNGLTTVRTYDDFGRKSLETRPDGTKTQWQYISCDTSNNHCGIADLWLEVAQTHQTTSGAALHADYIYYDGAERVRYVDTQLASGAFSHSIRGYSAPGDAAYDYLPYTGAVNGWQQYSYDLVQKPTGSTLYNAAGTIDRQTTLLRQGDTISSTDTLGHTMQQTFDARGNLRRVIDPSPGGTTTYAYDPFSNLTLVTDAIGATNAYTFDVRGFRRSSNESDRGAWTYTFNSLGEFVSQTDAKAQTMTMGYDALSRMTSRTEAEGTSTWTYGVLADNTVTNKYVGRLKSLAGPGYSEARTYDSVGRPVTRSITSDVTYQLDFSYNASTGLLDTMTYPVSTSAYRLKLQYGYSNGVLNSVSDFNAPATVFWTLNAQNERAQTIDETLGNGVHVITGYNSLTGLINYRTSGKNTTYDDQQKLLFNWDLKGNLADRIDANQANLTEHFVYDPLNRLDYSTLNGAQNFDITLDAVGNVTYKSDVGTFTYDPTKKHAVAATSNGWSFGYDANGNMLSGRQMTMTWTSYNLPSMVTQNTQNWSAFSYTPNRQYYKQVAQYSNGPETTMYVGGVLEKVSNTSTTYYRHRIQAGDATIIVSRATNGTNVIHYVTQDHLGSSSVVSDATGVVLLRSSFGAYGARRGSNWQGLPTTGDLTAIANTSRRGFTDQTTLDNVSLIHMNGRVYDPAIARFISADGSADGAASSQGWNRYSYVHNRPMSAVDPAGYSAIFASAEYDPNWTPDELQRWVEQERQNEMSSIVETMQNLLMERVWENLHEHLQDKFTDDLFSGPMSSAGIPGTLLAQYINGHGLPGTFVAGTGATLDEVGVNSTRDLLFEYMPDPLPVGLPTYLPPGPPGSPHEYALTVLTQCTGREAFDYLKTQWASAPGAPAAHEGFTARIDLWGFTSVNPISQVVDSSTLTIQNTTLPGHVFYPGDVNIKVSDIGANASVINVTGTGTSSDPYLNDAVGLAYFGMVVNTIQSLCAAQHGGDFMSPDGQWFVP